MSDGTLNKLDGRLRPIYEWYECIFIFSLSCITYFTSIPLGFSPFVQKSIVVLSLGWIAMRFIDGKRVAKYQNSLNQIDPFFVTPSTIPHTKDETWIGRGFEFTSVHAQRLWEAGKPKNEPYYRMPRSYKHARENEVKIRQLEREGKASTGFRYRKAKYTKKRTHTLSDTVTLYLPSPIQNTLSGWGFTEGNAIYDKLDRLGNGIKWRNRIAPLPPVGGDSRIHAVGVEDETDQFIDLDDRNGHTIVFGQSRTGKSRFLEFLLAQDIQRNDGPVILADPKGDAELLARAWSEAKRKGREDNFFVFALGFPEVSARYNAIATFSRLTAVATRISGSMQGSGDSSVFKDFAWRFLLIVANAMNGIGEKPSFKKMKRYIEDLEPIYLKYTEVFLDEHIPDWRESVDKIKNPPPRINANGESVPQRLTIPAHFKGRSSELVARDMLLGDFFLLNEDKINVTIEGLRSALKNEMNYYNKITASLIPLLTKLTSGAIADLISPNYEDILDERPEISWPQMIQQNAIVVVLADAMTDSEVANAVLGMMFSDLLSVAGDIYKHGIDKGLHGSAMGTKRNIWLHIDEFHSVLKGGSEGEPFQSITNRAAGAGVRLQAYTQTKKDIEDACGSETAAGVILGNFNNTVMLRVKTEETAEYLTQAVSKSDRYDIDVGSTTKASGAKIVDDDDDHQKSNGKANWFNTNNSMRVANEAYEPIITPQMIMGLPKGQAFALINGSKLLKLRFPLLQEDKNALPPTLDAMIDDLKAKYQRSDENEFTFH